MEIYNIRPMIELNIKVHGEIDISSYHMWALGREGAWKAKGDLKGERGE